MSDSLQPHYHSQPGSSVHGISSVRGISQARKLSGLPFLSSGDLPDPRIELVSLALQETFFITQPSGKPRVSSRY